MEEKTFRLSVCVIQSPSRISEDAGNVPEAPARLGAAAAPAVPALPADTVAAPVLPALPGTAAAPVVPALPVDTVAAPVLPVLPDTDTAAAPAALLRTAAFLSVFNADTLPEDAAGPTGLPAVPPAGLAAPAETEAEVPSAGA